MIKSYFNFHIDVKNLNSYREFLKRRPTKPQHFKFTMLQYSEELSRAEEKQIQLKLLKLLKIVKPIHKVDLEECEITDYDFWEPKLLSAWKTISNINTLFVMGPKSGSEFSYFKYFPKLKNVFYKLNSYSFSSGYDNLYRTGKPPDIHYDLKHLKYCPKIRSLGFADFSKYYDSSPKVVVEPNRYLRSLESLTLRGEDGSEDQFGFPINLCKNLKSVSLIFPNLDSWESLPQILDILSKLQNLQEISLSPILSPKSDLKAFRKIIKKGMLKKVQLDDGDSMCECEKILNALETCKLTNFYLKAYPKTRLIMPLYHFLKSMEHLESLELYITSSNLGLENDNLMKICEEISKLQALQHLKLHFQTFTQVSKDTSVFNFIPYLSDIFKRPIKIQTLHLGCSQLDPSEALQSLISVLANSAAFLTHLKMDFPTLPCSKKTYRSILKLMKKLENIQQLEIPCLAVSSSTSHFLNDITKAVYRFKYLRIFTIGEIKAKVSRSHLFHAVEAISSKRGLRHFDCRLSYDFLQNFRNEEHPQGLDLDRIFQKNPYLENFTLLNSFSPSYFDIYRWI